MRKILFMNDSLNGGGAERVLSNILNHIDYKEFEVTLFLIYGEGIYLKSIPKQVIIKYLVKGYNTIKQWNPLARLLYKVYIKTVLGLVKLFKGRPIYKYILREKYDVEISFLEGETCSFVAHSKNVTARKISWIHTDLTKRRTMDYTKEFNALSKMNRIVCVSNGSRESVISLYPQLSSKVQVIYNPVDKEQILNYSCEPIDYVKDRITIVFVGRIIKLKGIDILLKSHHKLISEGLEHNVIVLGEGNFQDELKNEINKLNVANSFILLGYKENPFPYIKAADIHVLPSLYEGFSLALVEAMVLGKPTIATKCVGPSEILTNEYGLLVEPGDIESLANTLRKLIEDKELQKYYSFKSLERSNVFNIDNAMKDINNLIG